MTRLAPTNAASLAARLRNLCRERAIPEGRALRLLGVVVVGQLLARTGVGVVKGATNVEVRVGTARARVSSDLDTVRRLSTPPPPPPTGRTGCACGCCTAVATSPALRSRCPPRRSALWASLRRSPRRPCSTTARRWVDDPACCHCRGCSL